MNIARRCKIVRSFLSVLCIWQLLFNLPLHHGELSPHLTEITRMRYRCLIEVDSIGVNGTASLTSLLPSEEWLLCQNRILVLQRCDCVAANATFNATCSIVQPVCEASHRIKFKGFGLSAAELGRLIRRVQSFSLAILCLSLSVDQRTRMLAQADVLFDHLLLFILLCLIGLRPKPIVWRLVHILATIVLRVRAGMLSSAPKTFHAAPLEPL